MLLYPNQVVPSPPSSPRPKPWQCGACFRVRQNGGQCRGAKSVGQNRKRNDFHVFLETFIQFRVPAKFAGAEFGAVPRSTPVISQTFSSKRNIFLSRAPGDFCRTPAGPVRSNPVSRNICFVECGLLALCAGFHESESGPHTPLLDPPASRGARPARVESGRCGASGWPTPAGHINAPHNQGLIKGFADDRVLVTGLCMFFAHLIIGLHMGGHTCRSQWQGNWRESGVHTALRR